MCLEPEIQGGGGVLDSLWRAPIGKLILRLFVYTSDYKELSPSIEEGVGESFVLLGNPES